jgi:hypothetical protein
LIGDRALLGRDEVDGHVCAEFTGIDFAIDHGLAALAVPDEYPGVVYFRKFEIESAVGVDGIFYEADSVVGGAVGEDGAGDGAIGGWVDHYAGEVGHAAELKQ